MKSHVRCLQLMPRMLLCILAAATPAAASKLSGIVRNGTTGALVPRQDVILIQLQGGMQPVETVKSDAQGRYQFDRPELGQAPMLVRVPYRGVNYHQNVPPATSTADVDVYEPTAKGADISVVNHAIIFQPQGVTLVVGEEFSIHNLSKPPATYFSTAGTFEFEIPQGATLNQVSAAGPAGMPLSQGTIDKTKNRYAVAFALKPGENTIRVSYQLSYEGSQAIIRATSPLAAQRVVLAGPAGVQISSDGFSPAGNEQGYAFFSRDTVAANSAVVVTISGSASAPAASDVVNGRDSSAAEAPAQSSSIALLPPRLANVQWILIGGFSLLFCLGVVYLLRQPRTGLAAAAGNAGLPSGHGLELPEGASKRKRDRAQARASEQYVASLPATSASTPAAPSSAPAVPLAAPEFAASVDRDVRLSLDELKDTLFRLELRHQAGTISDEDYARERARMESVLRNLVRG